MPTYLQKRRRRWYAVLDIPKNLHSVFGKARFKQSLETESLSVAERKVLTVIAEWKKQIETARGNELGSDDEIMRSIKLVRQDAMKLKYRGMDESDIKEAQESIAIDQALGRRNDYSDGDDGTLMTAVNVVAEVYQEDIKNFGYYFENKNEILNSGRIKNIPKRLNLSILIASLKNRELTLQRLVRKLGDHPNVEILLEIDHGELSIGVKRQKLLNRAKGQYVVYLDDDDDINDYFIQKILEKIQLSPDAIGYWIDHYIDGRKRFVKKMTLGLSSQVMYQNNMLSPLTHRAVVRREILNGFTFPDIDWGEDRPYWKHIEQNLSWAKVILLDEVLYYQFEKSGKYSEDGKHNGQ